MKTMVTRGALEMLNNRESDATMLVGSVVRRLKQPDGVLKGKFNRFWTPKGRILLVFLEENEANMMTYDEALALPGLGDACRERWK